MFTLAETVPASGNIEALGRSAPDLHGGSDSRSSTLIEVQFVQGCARKYHHNAIKQRFRHETLFTD